ncbi:hypothetical protein MPTK1_8g09920 [Marchantia polymorpha subsp. ruderalis]|uniref:PRELI/MSF1 domain-containing protein n=1 Tax=Marchantia polymorpha TaxID=3197 RepID=A0A2R6XMY4_MARPO|nr:hypothetical protein MARPO_0008s0230 [Marchantia polymorpha]BBN19349.1 hypothetical protein Mp_8g09920 [Marchantia polymorpha subsp. ruderalis]|eukprot:PTQ47484.1 hypothetical protein MARPO_0008s0230 [Marchantia polymorpha]
MATSSCRNCISWKRFTLISLSSSRFSLPQLVPWQMESQRTRASMSRSMKSLTMFCHQTLFLSLLSQLSHVLEVDNIDRKLDSEAGQFSCTQVITMNTLGPWWLQRILGESVCHCLENLYGHISINLTVDGNNPIMEMVGRNVTMKNFVEEINIRCVTLSVLATMAKHIEHRCVKIFQKNSFRGREVMKRVCFFMKKESASM